MNLTADERDMILDCLRWWREAHLVAAEQGSTKRALPVTVGRLTKADETRLGALIARLANQTGDAE